MNTEIGGAGFESNLGSNSQALTLCQCTLSTLPTWLTPPHLFKKEKKSEGSSTFYG